MIHNDKVLEDVNALLDYDSVKDFLFMNVGRISECRDIICPILI